MYKIINCEQGTDEWYRARLGKITASSFDKILTKTGKPSASWEEVVNRKVAEKILGGIDDGIQTDAMLRGQSLEQGALDFFNFSYDFNFKRIGFIENDFGFGCSPDGIDEENKIGLELKCPLAHNHLSYLLNGRLPDKYIQQVQGSLLVSGFEKWVFGSYHPSIKCLMVVVERDEKYIEKLRTELLRCCKEVETRYNSLL